MPALIRVRRDDRGAVATVVALLVAGGVLLGSAAMVVDVGQIYVERGEIRGGADAAALAVARACAAESVDCADTDAIRAVAGRYADANANDGVSQLVEVCGELPGRLPTCSGVTADNLTDCLGAAPTGPYVEVRLSTELPGDRFVLPPVFARAMTGESTFDGVSVGACARARWQEPVDVRVPALTISTCELNSDEATDDGRRYASTPPRPRDEYVIDLLIGSYSGPCPNPPGRWDRPSGAGFLTSGVGCEVILPVDGLLGGTYLPVAIGVLAPAACESRLARARADREVLLLPVHDAVEDNGPPDPIFRHTMVVPFVVTGYQFGPLLGGHDARSWLTGALPCPGLLRRCVSGLFVGPPTPLHQLVGNSIVELIG